MKLIFLYCVKETCHGGDNWWKISNGASFKVKIDIGRKFEIIKGQINQCIE